MDAEAGGHYGSALTAFRLFFRAFRYSSPMDVAQYRRTDCFSHALELTKTRQGPPTDPGAPEPKDSVEPGFFDALGAASKELREFAAQNPPASVTFEKDPGGPTFAELLAQGPPKAEGVPNQREFEPRNVDILKEMEEIRAAEAEYYERNKPSLPQLGTLPFHWAF